MAGALIGATVSVALGWEFVSAPALVGGVAVGVVFNGVLIYRTHRAPRVGVEELWLHIFSDLALLTWLLAWAGGLRNPLSVLYSFHVVLGALMTGRRGAIFATAVSGAFLLLLFVVEQLGALPMGALERPPELLFLCALGVLLLSLCYFGLVLSSRLREQRHIAEREHQEAVLNLNLFTGALDTLRVGLEIVEPDGDVRLANTWAARLAPRAETSPVPRGGDVDRYALDEEELRRVVDRVRVPATEDRPLGAVLYVDRTDELLVEQRHVMLERLATLGRALQGVAHELNTPLTTMLTLAKDLTQALAELDLDDATRADMVESVELILAESRRCRGLTQSLLETAGAPKAVAAESSQTALDVARRALQLLGHPPEKPGCAVALDEGSLDVVLPASGDRVLQVLMNLVQNALRATEDQRAQPGRVQIEAIKRADALHLRVLDRGPGLPEEVRARLFEPFVTTRPTGEGTGLGLYVSHRVARDLGGDLRIEDRDGGGSVAVLELPSVTRPEEGANEDPKEGAG
jgi:C4-dicarboxylate-specific signal transduction histidine kinase